MTPPPDRQRKAGAEAPKDVAGDSPFWRVHAALGAVQLSFGAFYVIARSALDYLHPLALAGMRLGLATPILLWIAWRHDRLVPPRRELPALAFLGLTGVFANQILFTLGLNWTTATNAALLIPTVPVFAAAIGALFGIERIGLRRALGIGLAVVGALVVLDPRTFSFGDRMALGNLLILTNCLCYSTYLVAQRPVLARLPWRTVIAWAFLFGTLGVELVAAPTLFALQPASVPLSAWLGVLYIVLFPTILSYSWNTWAIRRSSPSMAATYVTVQPLITAILAALFLGERFGAAQGASFVLLACGLLLVSRGVAAERGREAVTPALGSSRSR